MTIPRIHVKGIWTDPNISSNVQTIGNTRVFVPNIPEWLTDHPNVSVPNHPPATVLIGQPIINMPGCVEAHEKADKNNNIIEDDENNVLVFCDAGVPSYDAMGLYT